MPSADSPELPAQHWLAWCDGRACPNPGRIGLGAVLQAPDGRIFELSRSDPHRGCNNEAETRALLATLELAESLGARHIVIHSDSDNVVRLACDANTTEARHLAPLFAQVRECLTGFAEYEIRWLPQHRNAAADELARRALGLAARAPQKPRKRTRR